MLAESDELLAKLRVWLFKMKMILFAADKAFAHILAHDISPR